MTEEGVRRRIERLRKELRALAAKIGWSGIDIDIIENLPHHGYRLAPERVCVRVVSDRRAG